MRLPRLALRYGKLFPYDFRNRAPAVRFAGASPIHRPGRPAACTAMFKWLIFAVIVYVAFTLWKKGRLAGSGTPPAHGRHGDVERMVVCAHCGLYLPEGESLIDDGNRVY